MEEKTDAESEPIVVHQSPVAGRGVFAIQSFSKGDKIGYFEGPETDHPTYHSVTIDGQIVEPTGDLRFLNNSCDPNAEFHGRWLFALKSIAHEEEITIDYLATESTISSPFRCHCGSANCRKVIGELPA